MLNREKSRKRCGYKYGLTRGYYEAQRSRAENKKTSFAICDFS